MSEILPVKRFSSLFQGLDTAYGTGEGRWVKEAPKLRHFADHLAGQGPGLGIAPLREDGTVTFAAIDLDAPDFESAALMRDLLPGYAFIERSRSGNAHVWVFFKEPIEAWVVRGILREATAAIGDPRIEVFPKQDALREGMFGNYINLPYYGDTRPILDEHMVVTPLDLFVDVAHRLLNEPDEWRKRARWLGVPSPDERLSSGHHEFGTQPYLHICAEHIITNRETNPVLMGHRAVVYFNLACQLANCEMYDDDEVLAMLKLVADAGDAPDGGDAELAHILRNVKRGQYTRTGCDDPLFSPWAHPECPIAFPRGRKA